MQLLFRPQSLYLLLAVVCAGCMFLFPINTYDVVKDGGNTNYSLEVMGIMRADGVQVADAQPMLPFYVTVPLLGGILLITMFMYKNRQRQMRVGRASYLITILIIGAAVLANNSFKAYLGLETDVINGYGASFYLPFAILAFTFLANRSIKKDDDLVKSLDRLR